MLKNSKHKRSAFLIGIFALVSVAFFVGQKSVHLAPDFHSFSDYKADTKRFYGIWGYGKSGIFKRRQDIAVVGACSKEGGWCSLAETWVRGSSIETVPTTYKIQSWTTDTIVAAFSGECYTDTITFNFKTGAVSRVDHQANVGFATVCGDVIIPDSKAQLLDAGTKRPVNRDDRLPYMFAPASAP